MKNKFTVLLLIVSILFSPSILVSCEKKPQKYSTYSFDYFDTVTSVTGYEESKEEFDKVILVSGDGDYFRMVDFLVKENRFKKNGT